MSLQQYYDQFRQAHWADADASVCACHGSGYALSDVDTWHQCPVHFAGQTHPEDEGRETETETDAVVTVAPDPVVFDMDTADDEDNIPF
jgi:hypothetical protein